MRQKVTGENKAGRILSLEEMMLIKAGKGCPKDPSDIIIQPRPE